VHSKSYPEIKDEKKIQEESGLVSFSREEENKKGEKPTLGGEISTLYLLNAANEIGSLVCLSTGTRKRAIKETN